MKDFWNEHPNLELVYLTSDGEKFYQENDAKNHAKTLENKSVETVYNPSHLAVNDAIVVDNDAPELDSLTVAQLKQFAKDNGFDVPARGNKTEILAALESQMNQDSKQTFVDDETLLGSSLQPAEFKLADGSTLSLGDVVRTAFEQSGLSTNKSWNDLSEEDREEFIKTEVEKLALEATNPQD